MKKKLVVITAYDYPTAQIVEEAGVDYILVGDSLGMTVLGYTDTKSVTLSDMVHHVKAVSRGAKKSKIIADMPINTYTTPVIAVKNAKRLIKAGAHAVKIEGNNTSVIKALRAAGIQVMGHLGLLPQTAKSYKVQGRDTDTAEKILNDAKAVDKAGIFALVLECLPTSLAKKITESINAPTIGIGAGIDCSGQVLVLNDVIGLSDMRLKFVKQYANVKTIIRDAVTAYQKEVITGKFPAPENTFS